MSKIESMKRVLNFRTIRSILLALLIIAPLVFKMMYVDQFIYTFTGTTLLGATQVFLNDAIIYLVFFLLIYLSYVVKSVHLISIIFRVLAISVLSMYVMDSWIIINFNSHLVLTDVYKYASYSLKYILQIYSGKEFILLMVVITVAALVIPFILSQHKISNKVSHGVALVLMLSMFITTYVASESEDKYVHSWIYQNVIDYNLTIMSEGKAYSDGFKSEFSYEGMQNCYPETTETPNIILLMVESLSSYQSKYFSGINDWTPNLDEIASNGMAFNNFYANGFTTEDGEIALLTGQLPIYQPLSFNTGGGTSFKGFFDVKESLPKILTKQGYTSEFLTTADLEFANTGDWAKHIGFDYIEGHEHPYYEKWERFHFKAAPDAALYDRVLERVKINENNKHFIFIKTVSTHHPFVNPENKHKSEAEAFQYADRQIGRFYNQLNEAGFFENGMLLIVGDHHAMVPLKNEEIPKFGALKAAARVPLVISFRGERRASEQRQFQQIDVFNGLKGMVSGMQCNSEWLGNVLERKPAKYIAHRRGDNRNIISVFSGEKSYSVKLDGDDTELTGSKPPDEKDQEAIVAKINAVRIL